MMKFTKMHGLGNDYVYINGFEQPVDDPATLAPKIADRHFGVGGDGLIMILPPATGVDADVRMRMFNADGSESEMCGNGVRCVAKYAVDHRITEARPLKVQTGAGVLSIDYQLDSEGKLTTATVDMGPPRLAPKKIPVALQELEQVVNHPLKGLVDFLDQPWVKNAGLDARMTCVSMGNPHVTLFCENVNQVPLQTIGPVLENHRLFPRRINVHFVQIHAPGELTMRTWERGSGVTLACGTGASAVCVAGVLTGRCDHTVLAHLPGGDLTLQWQPGEHVFMTGPATEVFSGVWPGPMS